MYIRFLLAFCIRLQYDCAVQKAFKYRINPTKGQQRILEQQLETCRWIYNETLATRKRAWEERQESLRLS
jgi:putative transposase